MSQEPLSKEEMKQAVSAGIESFLSKKFETLGRWSFYSFMGMVVGALIYMLLRADGWHK